MGWTHSKFVVWVLFSFPERPGISELLDFVGSVIAAEGHSRARFLLEQVLLDLTSTKLMAHWIQSEYYPLSSLKNDRESTPKT